MKLFGKVIFRWPYPWMKWVVGAFVAVFLALAWIQESYGADFSLGVGTATGNTIKPSGASAVMVKAAVLFDDKWELAGRYYGEQDDTVVGDVDDYLAASFSYVAVLDKWEIKPYLTLGVAYAQENQLLAQEFNFNLAGGIQWRQWTLELHHFSNAGLEEPNYGQNDYSLMYTFKF